MKLVGFVGNDFNVDQLESLGAEIQHHGTVNANLIVVPYNAYIQFDSYDEARYRPYLQLDAEIHGGRGELGNDITEFTYREDDRLNRSVRYDFTDHELAMLVEKGLYYPDFEVPSLFTDTEFEIPMEMNITEIKLNDKRLVYASFDMLSDLQTDSEKSGYDLVTYFETQSFDRERVQNVDYDFEPQIGEHEEATTEVVAEVKDESQTEVEAVTETPAVEPIKVHDNPVDKLANVDFASIMTSDKPAEVEEIINDDSHGIEPATKAPKTPVISGHEIRQVTDEYDSGKARQDEMTRQALDRNADADFGGLTPDDAQDDVSYD